MTKNRINIFYLTFVLISISCVERNNNLLGTRLKVNMLSIRYNDISETTLFKDTLYLDSLRIKINSRIVGFENKSDKNKLEIVEFIDSISTYSDSEQSEYIGSIIYSLFEKDSKIVFEFLMNNKNSLIESYLLNEFCLNMGLIKGFETKESAIETIQHYLQNDIKYEQIYVKIKKFLYKNDC
jgi:hypothetical protein